MTTTINIPNIKKKFLTKFDKVVKAATSRAIPIVKKEAFKQIANTSTNHDTILKFVTAGILAWVVLQSDANFEPSLKRSPSAQTIINIETLNLWR